MFVPLQADGAPGMAEILLLLALLVLYFFVARYVYRDAQRRGSDRPMLWAGATFVGFFLGLVPGLLVLLVYYFVVRR